MFIIPYFSFIFKLSYFLFAIPTILVIISAALSSNAMGGDSRARFKKIAIGTIVDSILVTTYIFLERGSRGILNQNAIRYFFLGSAIFASTFLIVGYYQVYKIAKKLKLFTV